MKPDPKKPQTYELKDGEPSAGFATVPLWLIVAFGLVAYWGGLHIDTQGGEFNPVVYEPYVSLNDLKKANPPTGLPDPARGEEHRFLGLAVGTLDAVRPTLRREVLQ